MDKMTRKDMLAAAAKGAATLPVLGFLGAVTSPLIRFLRPTLKPFEVGALPEGVISEPKVVATLDELKEPWSYKEFEYEIVVRQYNEALTLAKKVPGYVVRLPNGEIYALSRICPHLGCIFNYEKDPEKIAANYRYSKADRPHLACPCHFSVFDPLQKQRLDSGKEVPGKVVSGPAPRPPFLLVHEIRDGKVVITKLEEGSVA